MTLLKTMMLGLAACAGAAPAWAGEIAVTGAQLRASMGQSRNTAGYMTIVNSDTKPDRLLSASCACGAKVEAHRTSVSSGMSGMAPAGPVVVPARGSVAFQPGGLHLMVMGLKAPLKAGAAQEITLRFERAGAVKARFAVVSAVAAPMAEHHHH